MKAPLFTLSIIALLSLSVQAQSTSEDQNVQREIGLSLHQFGLAGVPLGVVYKRGHDNKFWRFEASHLHYNMNHPTIHFDTSFNQNKGLNAGLGFTVAREKRKPLSDDFTFFHGPVLRLGGGFYRSESIPALPTNFPSVYRSYQVSVGLGYTLGMMYNITESLYVNAQLTPMASHSVSLMYHRLNDPADPQEFSSVNNHTNFQWFQGSATIGIFYRF